jgi:WS/DGAT/MGAT family acyltransferase
MEQEWGSARTMNPVETMMWRGEGDPRLRSTTCVVEVLDRAPEWERLRAAHEWATRVVPRFRKRVVDPGIGAPEWVLDPDFEIDRHLRRVVLERGGLREALDIAADLAAAPFDRDRPPWQGVLVEGLEGGEAAYILKTHHSSTDGIGAMQLFDMLLSDRREHTPGKPHPAVEADAGLRRPEVLAGQVVRGVRDAPGKLARTGRDVLGIGAHTLLHPRGTVAAVTDYAQSLQRVLASPPVAGSPVLAGRSLRWRFETFDVPLADLRAAGKAAGGSVNDAFVAALLGAFRRYHEAFRVPVAAMPVAIPIALSRGDQPMGANSFAGVRFAAPVGEPDPRERIRLIRETVIGARGEPAIDALGVVAPVLAHLPAPLLTRLSAGIAAGTDLSASNVPGVARPAYLAGAKVTRMYPFGPLLGTAAMIALVSHNGMCCVGANLDAAAVTDPDLFADCLREGFGEVLALGSEAPAGVAG